MRLKIKTGRFRAKKPGGGLFCACSEDNCGAAGCCGSFGQGLFAEILARGQVEGKDMSLAVAVESLDDIAETLRGEYEEVNGRFVLKLDGINSHPSVMGLKTNHDRLLKEVADTKAKLRKLDGVDPEKYQQLTTQVEELQEQIETLKVTPGTNGRGAEEDIERRVQRAIEKLRKEHTNEVQVLSTKLSTVESERNALSAWQREQTVTRAVEAAVIKAGVRPDAIAFAVDRGLKVFKLSDEGKIVAEDEEGLTKTGKDGVKPLTPIEWVTIDLYQEAPFLFPPSGGGGAGGGAGNKRFGGVVSKEDFKTEKEEAEFMVKHGAEAYRSLPGKSKFLSQYMAS